MKEINLNLLNTFFYVYKLRSYTKASASLECTPSNITQKIQRLEQILDSALFVKRKKALDPTDEAHKLFEKTYKHFQSLEEEINSFQSRQTTFHLEILTSTGASLVWLISEINNFTEKHADFSFRICTTEDSTIHPDSSFDIIALPQKLDLPNYKKIAAVSFTTKLYASQKYIDKFGVPQTPEDLDNHRLISFYHKSSIYRGDPDWHLRVGRPPSDPRKSFLIVNNMMGIGQSIASSLGIAALTDNNPYIQSHHLIRILPKLKGTSSTLYVLYKPTLENNPFIREMMKKKLVKI
jgi:DNA-binding transcriptional LysR family regulator